MYRLQSQKFFPLDLPWYVPVVIDEPSKTTSACMFNAGDAFVNGVIAVDKRDHQIEAARRVKSIMESS
jgi:transposase